MSEPSQSNPDTMHVLENVLIKGRNETNVIISKDEGDDLHVSVEKEISQIVQASDPISPATAVPTNDATPLSDDDDPKIILNLETSPLTKNANLAEVSENGGNEDKNEVNKKAMEQLDSLVASTQKRGRASKIIQKDPLGFTVVQAEHISTKSAEQSSKQPVKLHNRVLATASSTNDVEKDVLAISVEKTKKVLNPLATQANNEDLVAILEGNDDKGEDDEAHYEVVEIIGDSDSKEVEPTIVASVISREDERKIALEQMSTIPSRSRKRKAANSDDNAQKPATATEFVKSLASEWSDNEKETDNTRGKKSTKKEPQSEKKVVEPKIEPFKRTRIIKKKIIWDPDAPETQFSYASLVQSSAKKQQQQKQQEQKQQEQQQQLQPQQQKKVKQAATPKKIATPPVKAKEEVSVLRGKRRSETPTTLNNKKKKLSEIDKLLGDEGAANMIHSLENEKLQEKDSKIKKEPGTTNTEKQEKRETPTSRKRVPKSKASSSWDYVYNQRNVDAMIIRRRSNSSYSSTSPRRLSLEQSPANHIKTKISPSTSKVSPTGTRASVASKASSESKSSAGTSKVNMHATRGRNFEFAKPEVKKAKKDSEESTPLTVESKKSETKEVIRKSNRTPTNVDSNEVVTKTPVASKVDKIQEVEVKKHANVAEIILQPKQEKIKNSFTLQMMNEVVKQLEILKSDTTCKVVFFTSTGQNFCQGIDFISLTVGAMDKRKAAASELAASVKNFLEAIASFPKPLIAGVNGLCSGIGVTMLPLFDVVISSDKCTFEANYAKIGQIPEGNCILQLTNNVRHNFKTKLIWMCDKYTSTEAALSGLVTKLTNPNKIQSDALLCAKRIAALSQQTLCSIKSQRQKHELPKLITALAEEEKILTQQWVSPECQEKFKQYLQKDCW